MAAASAATLIYPMRSAMGPDGWTMTFTDPRLYAAAIVDRLSFNGAIIETGTDSYRLARTKASQNA